MKLSRLAAAFVALTACAGAAVADTASLNQFRPKVMPVLVQVNSHGKVTAASPAIELSPRLTRLLRENLDEMISHPATDKRGRPMSSQFVINLALQSAPRPTGDYDVRFAYVSTSPVPAGSWYWVHIDGHRLALAPQHPGYGRQRMPSFRQHEYSPRHSPSYAPTSTPPLRQTVQQTPKASPAGSAERIR